MGEMIEISTDQLLPAYIARPSRPPMAAVIVVHEAWGLVDHIKSVADRLAVEGYIALAPDLLHGTNIDTSNVQGLQEALFDPERRNQVQPELRELMAPMQNPKFGFQTTARLKACFDYVYHLPESKQKVAIMGFCFGGSYSFSLAIEESRLVAAIPFYGHSDQDAATLKRIQCPVLAFYGEQDERLISALPDLRARMKTAGVDFTAKVYPGSGHAFFNDTNQFAYNQTAAADAWQLVLDKLQTAADQSG